MSTITRPRQPAGSPAGGEFAPIAGTEATISLSAPADGTPSAGRTREAMVVTRQARDATDEQVNLVCAAYDGGLSGAKKRAEAKRALRTAAHLSGWTDFDTAMLTSEGWHDVATALPQDDLKFVAACKNASIATCGAELVGHHGYTRQHHDTLMKAWRAGFPDGEAAEPEHLWDEATVTELRTNAYVFGDRRDVMIAANSSPANALEAARRALGTTDVRFSHLKNNCPVYTIA